MIQSLRDADWEGGPSQGHAAGHHGARRHIKDMRSDLPTVPIGLPKTTRCGMVAGKDCPRSTATISRSMAPCQSAKSDTLTTRLVPLTCITASAPSIFKPTSMSSRSGSIAASIRLTHSAPFSASRAASGRQPPPRYIPANGRTLHVVTMGVKPINTLPTASCDDLHVDHGQKQSQKMLTTGNLQTDIQWLRPIGIQFSKPRTQ